MPLCIEVKSQEEGGCQDPFGQPLLVRDDRPTIVVHRALERRLVCYLPPRAQSSLRSLPLRRLGAGGLERGAEVDGGAVPHGDLLLVLVAVEAGLQALGRLLAHDWLVCWHTKR